MKTIHTILLAAIALVFTSACSVFDRIPYPDSSKDDNNTEDTETPRLTGREYVFDMSALPEIHIDVTLEEWNKLLGYYDENHDTDKYIKCDARFVKGADVYDIDTAGLRLRGNTSRRRPEGNDGQMHVKDQADWHHCHFMLNLRKHVKDDEHTIRDVRKIHLKWFKDDGCYARELYCYDLFRRFDIPTALMTSYCRLWIHVEGDSEPAYYGVYSMLEAVDEQYLKARKDVFGNDGFNLWKCGYGADLLDDSDHKFRNDDDAGTTNYPYVLKTNTDNYESAKAQLQDFIRKVKGKSDESFKEWIVKVTDVELLLRTYAVNVAVGMWDDLWCNTNNYYIYFNSSDQYDYQFFFIPYDYDNTLGTSNSIDPARHNPLEWGNMDNLIARLLRFPEYKKIYLDALNELCDSDELFGTEGSIARISDWHSMISPYISNDTGEDMSITDVPGSWGHFHDYRVLTDGPDNFFRVKAETVRAIEY